MERLKLPVIKILIAIFLTMPLALSGCGQGGIEKDKKVFLFMDKYHGPTVTLSGMVVFPDYAGGAITIFASRRYSGPPDIILAEIPSPGKYSVKVPKDLGDIHLRARSFAPGEKPNRSITGASGRYRNNPLKIGSIDIKGVDIVITQTSFLIMDFYLGPTVTVSGKVIFPDYKSGEIAISFSSKNQTPTDIALLIIPRPGEYTIKVPKNFGDVYLQAKSFNSTGETPLNSRVARYKQNPLKVSRYDIKGIDVVF